VRFHLALDPEISTSMGISLPLISSNQFEPLEKMRKRTSAEVRVNEVNKMKKILTLVVIAIFTLSIATLSAPAKGNTSGNSWTLTVLSPTPYQVITTTTLSLHVFANNYQFDSRYAGTPDLSTIGHYHEILDGRLIDMSPTTDPQHDTISMVGVVPGLHVLTIVPARNDHSMVMSSAVMVPFYYEGPFLPQPTCTACTGSPTISIVPPTSTTVSGNSFHLSITVQNFVFSNPSFGKELVSGVGHWHVFLDNIAMPNMLTMAFTDNQQVYLTGVAPGVHTFYAVLVNNQHMPLMDPATGMLLQGTYDAITLNVNPID